METIRVIAAQERHFYVNLDDFFLAYPETKELDRNTGELYDFIREAWLNDMEDWPEPIEKASEPDIQIYDSNHQSVKEKS